MVKVMRFPFCFFATGILLVCSTSVFGQNTQTSTIGLPPNGVFDSTGFDSINLNSGNLHIDIPLLNRKERGNVDNSLRLIYDSQDWELDTICGFDGWCTQDTIPGPAMQWKLVSSSGYSIDLVNGPCEGFTEDDPGYLWESYFIYITDGNNTQHTMIPNPTPTIFMALVTPTVVNQHAFCDAYTDTKVVYAQDGSGISYYTGNTPNGPNDFTGPTPSNIHGSAGTQDTNGNGYPPTFVFPEGADTIGSGNYAVTYPNGGYTNYPYTLASEVDVTYKDANGASQTIRLAYSQQAAEHISMGTNYWNSVNGYPIGAPPDPPPFSGTINLLQSIQFPNGTSYTFAYDPYGGFPTSATLPTGGSIQWGYGGSGPDDNAINAGPSPISRMLDNDPARKWIYNVGQSGGFTIDPLGTKKSYTFDPFSGNMMSETIADASGRIVQTTKNIQGLPSFIQANGLRDPNLYSTTADQKILESDISVALAGQSVSASSPTYAITMDYDGIILGYPNNYLDIPITINQVISRATYDFGPGAHGPLLKQENFTYDHIPNTGILDRPLTHNITGSGNSFSETWEYDNYSQTALVSTSGVPVHDYTKYSSNFSHRGNMTSHSVWDSSQNTWRSTTYAYDDLGNVVSSTDPLVYTTHYSYDDVSDGVCTPPSNSHAYMTQVTDVYGDRTRTQYNYCTGLPTEVWDENELQANVDGTKSSYDLMNNSVTKTGPLVSLGGGQSGNSTVSMNYGAYAIPLVTTSTTLATPDPSIVTKVTHDDLGRSTQTVLNQNGPGTESIIDTSYDPLGRKLFTSTPYASTSTGGDTYYYDALDRMTEVLHADNTSQNWSYSGNATTFTDEALNSWTRTTDALGRLTNVVEPGNLQTTYTYDVLGNLLTVYQAGTLPCFGSRCPFPVNRESPHVRSFTYDSLSHLITSTNPETGTICYGTVSGGTPSPTNCNADGYDADGNLRHKTNANNKTVDYTYDALNRLTSKTSAQDTETNFFYAYDQGANGIGRLSNEWRPGVAGTIFTYDPMGRVANTSWYNYAFPGPYQNGMSVLYDLAGHTTQLTYPDSRSVQQAWDGAGQLLSVTDTTGGTAGQVYFGNATYAPSGALVSAQFGNGVTESMTLNSRLQPCRTAANSSLLAPVSSGANLYDRQAFYGNSSSMSSPEPNCGSAANNNGNIWTILEMNSANMPSQNFTYDGLNRLTSAVTTNRPTASSYSHSYNYDSFGNMLKHDAINGDLNYAIDPGTNRLTLNGTLANGDLQYDNAGNLVQFPNPPGAPRTAIFTAEGDIRCISDGANACGLASYLYNGSGERTYSVPNNQFSREYVYLNSQVMEDIVIDTGVVTDYIYANGRKIAKVDSAKPLFQMKGVRTANTLACGLLQQDSSAASVLNAIGAIQPNDMLFVDMFEPTSSTGATMGGFVLQLNSQYWAPVDAQGIYSHEQQAADGLWHHRSFAIGQQAAGYGITYLGLNMQNPTPAGNWEIDYANMTYVRGDGTVLNIPLEADGLSASPQNSCASTNLTGATASVAVAAEEGTSYFLDDHLGTTQMELSAGGWPIWQGWFTPFGQELGQIAPALPVGNQLADGTNMRFKFTGKERDTESGLDYFGARYYASSMGRWMSPDWAAKAEPVPYASLGNPQSLNLYAYVSNNPLRMADRDGHEGSPTDDSMTNLFDEAAKNGVRGFLQQGRDSSADATVGQDGKLHSKQTVDVDGRTGWQKFKGAIAGFFTGVGTVVGRFTLIHSNEALDGAPKSFEYWNKQSTEEIIKSLNPGGREPLIIRWNEGGPRVINGNVRLTILSNRGADTSGIRPTDVDEDYLDAIGARSAGGKAPEEPIEPIEIP